MNISLTLDDFRVLVRGGIVRRGDVQIGLQDIGFDWMDSAIQQARMEARRNRSPA
jgi:hypothetical protein